MTLAEALPRLVFSNGEFDDTRAYRLRNETVAARHGWPATDDVPPWPGRERYVSVWVELDNGLAVGWNENPSRGWSFPVIRYKKPNHEWASSSTKDEATP